MNIEIYEPSAKIIEKKMNKYFFHFLSNKC